MEVGSQASPFEHEPAGVTLSKCQRYFFYYGWPETGQYHWLYPINTTNGGGYRRGTLTFPTTMRAEPTCTVTIINTSGASSGVSFGDITSIGFTLLLAFALLRMLFSGRGASPFNMSEKPTEVEK